MNNKLKVGIVGVDHLNGNRGVGALAYSSIFLLNTIAKQTNREIEIYNINQNNGKYIIDIDNGSIEVNCISPIDVFSIKGLLKILLMPRQIHSLIKYLKLECVFAIGGGDSFSDIYGTERFDSINYQHRLARFFNKKYILLPQTIGPYKNNRNKKQAIKSIEKSSLVFARDLLSYKYVKENSQQNNIFEAIDMAFFMPYQKSEFDSKYINVGINISALLWHGGYTKDNQFGLKDDYKELMNNIIMYFLLIPNVIIHLIPHVVHEMSHIENDYEVSYELQNIYKNSRVILSPFFLTPITAKNYISGLDFFVGARMHATIAAFSSGVPVFPLAYSRKFNGLFKDTLTYDFMGDLVNEDKKDILSNLEKAFESRQELKDIIKSRIDSIIKDREVVILDNIKAIFNK